MVFAVNNTSSPWSSVSKKIGDVSSMREAMEKANVNYSIVKEPLCRTDGSVIPNNFGVMREDTGQVFDTVKNSWQPLQNVDAFNFFDPMIEEGLMTVDSVGAIKGGERMFITCKINQPPMTIVGNDIINPYMLLLNSHNAKSSIRVGFIPIRFSCTNQLPSIMRNGASQILRIRHSRSPKDSLEGLREVLNLAAGEFQGTQEQLQFLASRPITYSQTREYIKTVLGIEEEDKDIPTRSLNIIETIVALSENGRGNDVAGIRGTFYAATMAFNEYINYYSGRNVDTRMESLWLGKNAVLNSKALTMALEMAS